MSATTATTTRFTEYTTQEIAKHNTRSDAWVTHSGWVMDITKFLVEGHPGGADVVLPCLGGDVQAAMIESDHSPYAYQLIKDFTIGVVKGSKRQEINGPALKTMRGYTCDEIRTAVDFAKPSLPQVAAIGDKYWPWIVSRPVCHANRIFKQDLLEALSHYPWYYIFIVWPPTFWYVNAGVFDVLSPSEACTIFAAGLLGWTLLEYVLHRFVFHMEVWSNAGNVFHYFAHGLHHLTPNDATRLTFPPYFAAMVAYTVWVLIHACIADPVVASMFWTGVFAGYVVYDWFHFLYHHSESSNPVFKYLKRLHMSHHYKNDQCNFGVSSPLWDLLLGTYDPAYKVVE